MDQPIGSTDFVGSVDLIESSDVALDNGAPSLKKDPVPIKQKRRKRSRKGLWTRGKTRTRPRLQLSLASLEPVSVAPRHFDAVVRGYDEDHWMANEDNWRNPQKAEDEFFHRESTIYVESPERCPRDCFLTEGLLPDSSEPFPVDQSPFIAGSTPDTGDQAWTGGLEVFGDNAVDDQVSYDLLVPEIKLEPLQDPESPNERLVIDETVDTEGDYGQLTYFAGHPSDSTLSNYPEEPPVSTLSFLPTILNSTDMSFMPTGMSLRPRRIVQLTGATTSRRQTFKAVVNQTVTPEVLPPVKNNLCTTSGTIIATKKKAYWLTEGNGLNGVRRLVRRNPDVLVGPGMPASSEKRRYTDHNKKERERRFFIQKQFQDLKTVLGLLPTASKINILKEAQLECSALTIQCDTLESVRKEVFNENQALISKLSKLAASMSLSK